MARAPRRGGSMIAATQFGAAMNFHNQGVTRAEYQGPRGSGFTVEFLGGNALTELKAGLAAGAVVIRETAIEAVVSSTDEIKQRLRSYLDTHFTGSAMHGNNHRRASNAAVQSVIYDDIAQKGQYAGLIYSKFGFRDSGGFVDFLLLHVRGGTIRPKSGEWLRIPNRAEPGSMFAQSGNFIMSDSSIFFVKSKDGSKLFQLRRYKTTGATKLLATLVKSLTFAPKLAGVDVIAAQRGAVFERDFDAIFARKKSEAGFA